MLLYRTQPKNGKQSNIINLDAKERLISMLGDFNRFNNKRITVTDFTTLITDASIVDALLCCGGYGNILVVTSFEDSVYDRLRDRNYRAVKSAGDHFLPIVHKFNESDGKMTVTSTKGGTNFFKPIYEKFGVDTIDVDGHFRVDGDFKIKTDKKFDAVVLLGSESFKKGSFKASDVKKKFARYCTSTFDLIDIYRNDLRDLKGGADNLEDHIERVIECVNTPEKVYDKTTRLVTSAGYMKHLRQQLLFYRLALNLENVNEYYKVY